MHIPVTIRYMPSACGPDGVFYEEGCGCGPAPASEHAAGVDLRACLTAPVIIEPGERAKIPTGVAMHIGEPGYAGFVYSRSGLGAKQGLTVAQGVGLIDPDYRGEIFVFLLNTSGEAREVCPGERIAQLVIQPFRRPAFTVVQDLETSERGAGGFGSTGA